MNSGERVLIALKREEVLASAPILHPSIPQEHMRTYIQAARSNN